MAKKKMDSYMEYLFNGILSLESVEDCMKFFEDLCTVTEVIEMSKRLCAAKMLSDDLSYVDIIERTGLSSATISRVNRSLNYGNDGYELVFSRTRQANTNE
jgi:TrpR-related protein YerC/YecD